MCVQLLLCAMLAQIYRPASDNSIIMSAFVYFAPIHKPGGRRAPLLYLVSIYMEEFRIPCISCFATKHKHTRSVAISIVRLALASDYIWDAVRGETGYWSLTRRGGTMMEYPAAVPSAYI